MQKLDKSTKRTAVITGASSGVGRSAAIQLASAGWNIIGLGRDAGRCHEAEVAIREAAQPTGEVHMVQGDLALLSDTARMAQEVLDLAGPIHALLNNAGGVRDRMTMTAEGNEATFAGNHLGPFLLTRQLLPRLRKTARENPSGTVRIVNVSSEGHKTYDAIDWDDFQRLNNWASGRNYSLAKLYNMLFTLELAKRESANGIVAHAMHPGEAASNFGSHAVPEMQAYMATLDMISPDVGGRTLMWLASSPEAGQSTGGYFFDCAPAESAPIAKDAQAAARLWNESEELVLRAGI